MYIENEFKAVFVGDEGAVLMRLGMSEERKRQERKNFRKDRERETLFVAWGQGAKSVKGPEMRGHCPCDRVSNSKVEKPLDYYERRGGAGALELGRRTFLVPSPALKSHTLSSFRADR